MQNPEPPKGCPFFRVISGGLIFSPSAFNPAIMPDLIYINMASPAERYAAACVAMIWPSDNVDDFYRYWPAWYDYRQQARAEMEASNESQS